MVCLFLRRLRHLLIEQTVNKITAYGGFADIFATAHSHFHRTIWNAAHTASYTVRTRNRYYMYMYHVVRRI